MADYPDYTDLMHIIGTDIMVAIDVQGAYIMMPVDIQAQWVDLDVAITAENIANIMLALTAETMENIKIDITAQTVGNIEFDIKAQSVGIYNQPEWAALKGTDIEKVGHVESVVAGDDAIVMTETVDTDYTWYITDIWCIINTIDDFTVDKGFAFGLSVTSINVGVLIASGGSGGGHIHLNKPLKRTSGQTFYLCARNLTNAEVNFYGGILGFRVKD